jgi:alpha-D-ribose 1-methylphosphonate 5-triphosphate diphosphatase
MTESLIFTNAWVVTRTKLFNGTVEVLGGHIVAVYRGTTSLPGAFDLDGDYLLPGLVELHTDNLDRYLSPRPGVRWPVLPAIVAHDAEVIGAGITTVFDALTLGDVVQGPERIVEVQETVEGLRNAIKRDLMRSCHHLHLRCEVSYEGMFDLFAPHATDALVRLVSVMDHAPGQRQYIDVDKYRQWYESRHGFSEGEVEVLIDRHREGSLAYAETHRSRVVEFCRKRDLPLASHDDATVEHVCRAADEGAVISEFPTTGEAARAAHDRGLKVLMGAPNVINGGSHSGNVSAGSLAAAGLLDILSSDYYPASLLQAAFALHRPPIRLPLPEAIAKASANPADVSGLSDRGEIAPGKRADLVRVCYTDGFPAVQEVWRGGRRVF